MRLLSLKFRYIFLCAAIVFAAISFAAWPAIALTISPVLILIEGKDRYADVSLVNGGEIPENYEVAWKFYKMEPGTGHYQESDVATTAFDLTQNMVFTPKRALLGPKGVQKVRLGLRLQGEPPPPGDYRAHLELREIEGTTPAEGDAQKGMQVGVKINVGFTIPVVYRVDEPDVTAEIGDVTTRINPETKKIEALVPVTLSESPYGVLGSLFIYYDGALVGEIRNANIFPEARNRTFNAVLKTDKLSGGTLRVVLMDYRREKNKMYAQKLIPVNK